MSTDIWTAASFIAFVLGIVTQVWFHWVDKLMAKVRKVFKSLFLSHKTR